MGRAPYLVRHQHTPKIVINKENIQRNNNITALYLLHREQADSVQRVQVCPLKLVLVPLHPQRLQPVADRRHGRQVSGGGAEQRLRATPAEGRTKTSMRFPTTACSSPAPHLIVLPGTSPGGLGLQRGRMSDEPVQRGQEGVEGGSVAALGLPALQHQGVQRGGAVVWGREAILVCYCLHHLQREGRADGGRE